MASPCHEGTRVACDATVVSADGVGDGRDDVGCPSERHYGVLWAMLGSRVSRGRAVLLVWLLLTALTLALHLQAQLGPSRGRAFVGNFHWIDDVYNYLSYVQQSEAGHFLFRNKLLDPGEARPLLVNLEWWLVGRASAAMGGHPILAFRLLGVLATLALVAGAERWLSRVGVPSSHRVGALLLVTVGGGVGGLALRVDGSAHWTVSRPFGGDLSLPERPGQPSLRSGDRPPVLGTLVLRVRSGTLWSGTRGAAGNRSWSGPALRLGRAGDRARGSCASHA